MRPVFRASSRAWMAARTLNQEETRMRQRKLFGWAIAIAGVGLLDSVWLLILHLTGEKLAAACHVGASINCSVITGDHTVLKHGSAS